MSLANFTITHEQQSKSTPENRHTGMLLTRMLQPSRPPGNIASMRWLVSWAAFLLLQPIDGQYTDFGSYPKCFVCGSSDERVGNPNVGVQIPVEILGIDEITCGTIAVIGLLGQLPPFLCTTLQSLEFFKMSCGCEGLTASSDTVEGSSAPTSTDSTAPTDTPLPTKDTSSPSSVSSSLAPTLIEPPTLTPTRTNEITIVMPPPVHMDVNVQINPGPAPAPMMTFPPRMPGSPTVDVSFPPVEMLVTSSPVTPSTMAPTAPISMEPTEMISSEPTEMVSLEPTEMVSLEPTEMISMDPTQMISTQPSEDFTDEPSIALSFPPTISYSLRPSISPTDAPSPLLTSQHSVSPSSAFSSGLTMDAFATVTPSGTFSPGRESAVPTSGPTATTETSEDAVEDGEVSCNIVFSFVLRFCSPEANEVTSLFHNICDSVRFSCGIDDVHADEVSVATIAPTGAPTESLSMVQKCGLVGRASVNFCDPLGDDILSILRAYCHWIQKICT